MNIFRHHYMRMRGFDYNGLPLSFLAIINKQEHKVAIKNILALIEPLSESDAGRLLEEKIKQFKQTIKKSVELNDLWKQPEVDENPEYQALKPIK